MSSRKRPASSAAAWKVPLKRPAALLKRPAAAKRSGSTANAAAANAEEEHYAVVTRAYEASMFYADGSEFQRSVVRWCAEALKPAKTECLVDLGGGTGNFTLALRAHCGLIPPCVVVDPSAEMLRLAREHGLQTQCADAVAFSSSSGPMLRPSGDDIDCLLLKEVVHHLSHDEAELSNLFADLVKRLRVGGRLLIVTRPRDPDYPLFEAARRVWRMQQPPATLYEAALRAAGLEVATAEHRFRWQISTSAWLEHVSARTWSTFSAEHFNDEELAAGIEEIRMSTHSVPELVFDERLILILGTKVDSRPP